MSDLIPRTSELLESLIVERFDETVDRAMQPMRANGVANRVFYTLSEAANHSIMWHALTWTRVLLGRDTPRNAARISLILGIESALVNGPVKMVFRRQRPLVDDPRPHALRQPQTSSFPSGHATSAACAALLLSGSGRGFDTRARRGALGILAGAVAVSRVHVQIHHASDVVGGIAFGTVFGRLARRLVR